MEVYRVHSVGSVKGYPYYTASLFVTRTTADGRQIWTNSGTNTGRRSTRRAAERDGREAAELAGVDFLEGYGSLHNRPTDPNRMSAHAAG